MSDRLGIEIDYCPKCRGVWLDRGELDKIIERSQESPGEGRRDDKPKPYYKDQSHQQHYPYKRRKGFLGDLFDLD
jgi:Zn-finger nucleic acid-binding protein